MPTSSREADIRPGPVAVLEIGGTHVTAAVVDPTTWQVDPESQRRSPIRATASAEAIVGELLDASNALAVAPGSRWGVAIPGPFDYRRGIGMFVGVQKFDDLFGYDLRSSLMAGISSTPGSIGFIDDAEAFLVGEWLTGSAHGYRRCVALTLGTGIGSGFLAEGTLVDNGPSVPPAGRVHRLYVDTHPLEDLVSRRAIVSRYREEALGPTDGVDVREICALARDGDPDARRALDATMAILGRAVAPWLDTFDAEILVIGGSISRSWDVLEEPFLRGLSGRAELRSKLVVGRQPDASPLVGAAWAGTREALTPPAVPSRGEGSR